MASLPTTPGTSIFAWKISSGGADTWTLDPVSPADLPDGATVEAVTISVSEAATVVNDVAAAAVGTPQPVSAPDGTQVQINFAPLFGGTNLVLSLDPVPAGWSIDASGLATGPIFDGSITVRASNSLATVAEQTVALSVITASPSVLTSGSIYQTALGATTASGSVSTTGSDGTLHFVGIEATDMAPITAPLKAEVKAGQRSGGAPADSAASQAVAASGAQAISAVGALTLSRVHRWFAVHETAVGLSDVFEFDPFVTAVNPASLASPATHNALQAFLLPLQPACYTDTAGTTLAGVGDPVRRIGDTFDPSNYALLTGDALTLSKPPILREDVAGRWYLEPDSTLTGLTSFEAANATNITDGTGQSDHAALVWLGANPSRASGSGFGDILAKTSGGAVSLSIQQLDTDLVLFLRNVTGNIGGIRTGDARDGSIEAAYGWRKSNGSDPATASQLLVNGSGGSPYFGANFSNSLAFDNAQKLIFNFDDDFYGAAVAFARFAANADLTDAAADLDFYLRALVGRNNLPAPRSAASTATLSSAGIA